MFALSRTARVAWPPPQEAATSMTRCLVLAALVHALLIVLLGNTPGGTAQPGEGVWGPLNVLLRGTPDNGAPTNAQPESANGPVGTAAQQRWGGAVRDEQQAPRSNDGPGASKLGSWSATVSEAASELASGAPPPLALPQDTPPSTLPNVLVAPARITTPTPAAQVMPAPSAAQVLPQLSDAPAPLAPAAPVPVPAKPAPPIPSIAERMAPPSSEARPSDTPRAAPADTEAKLKMIDSAATLPTASNTPSPNLERLPSAPQTPLSLPALADAPAAPRAQVNAPAAVKAMSALPVVNVPSQPSSAERPAVLPDALPRTDPAVLPSLAEAPAAPNAQVNQAAQIKALPALATGSALPAAVPRLTNAEALPRSALSTETLLPSAAKLPELAVPNVRAGTAAAVGPAATTATVPRAPGAATTAQPGATSTNPGSHPSSAFSTPGAGAPDAGARTGRDVATPPSASASAPLNLNLARPRGGEIARDGARSVLNLLPHPPERKSKLEEGIEKSAKKDCRDAYSGMGIFAVIPLAANAVTDKCKW